ncbi:MAG TPA: hypothetical protein VKA97_12480, partial [Pyrinomonadaceae bacterium]|nr:hypothetical protein [Pyrinomonadaceae bacterium]
MTVLQPFAALYVLLLASGSPLLAKESERICDLYVRIVFRLRKPAVKEVEEVEEAESFLQD